MELGYAGDISPTEAWQKLATDPRAVLVDVRTQAEWSYVGQPDLGSLAKPVHRLSWQIFPEMQVNAGFVDGVKAAGIEPDQPILLLCRSGVRSAAAAKLLTERGFTACYNIRDGFEGAGDAEKHRGRVAGWKVEGLPWVQG
ncbi:MAG TPA: rhodanese-like domain-containing protein [Aliidongia sp.]|nr:rhodanese-like domain-containing protein [Aliidongia sp.]